MEPRLRFVLCLVLGVSLPGANVALADAAADCEKLSGAAAIAACSRVIEKQPKKVDARAYRGVQRFASSDYTGAIADFDRVLAAMPEADDIRLLRALAYGRVNDVDRALTECDLLVAKRPLNPRFHSCRGEALLLRLEFEPAKAAFTRAIELNPGVAEAHLSRSIARELSNDLDGAMSDIDEAIRLDPTDSRIHAQKASLFQTMGSYDRAISSFDRAIAMAPKDANYHNDRGAAFQHMGAVAREAGDHDRARDADARAIADFDRASSLDPTLAEPMANKAWIRLDEGDAEGAVADFDRALTRDPDKWYWQYGRAIALMEAGITERALADFTALAGTSEKPGLRLGELGTVRMVFGDFAGARRDLLRVIEVDDDVRWMVLRQLARLRSTGPGSDELEADLTRVKHRRWPYAVAEMLLGRRSIAATRDAAEDAQTRCTTEVLIGEWHLARAETAPAAEAFDAAARLCEQDHSWNRFWRGVARVERRNLTRTLGSSGTAR